LFNGAPDADCRVFVRELGDRRYFIKHYRAGAWSWRNLLATSKVRHEWNNLHYFRRLGIQTPVPVAIGELRRYGVFSRGVLVTEEVVGAIDLAKLASSQPAYLHDRVWYAELCRQLALPLKTLHDTGFAHNDLNWRNVLLTLEPLSVYFFDCPSGRRWFWPFRKFRLTKDLTHLDKMGRRYLSRTQRLRFYLTYAGHARLDPRDKRWLKQVLNREVSGKYQPEAQ
jgi:tRNA A-37 threonylcarbamoyl transferase component Bud32